MRILFLSTWFPYPLSQGSKIRAYHLLRALARRHEVVLVSFAEAGLESRWRRHMETLCSAVHVVEHDPFTQTPTRAVRGWMSLQPKAAVTSYSPQMAETVRSVVRTWQPERVLALTFVTAPYALGVREDHAARIVDVDNLLAPMLQEDCLRAKGGLARLRRRLAWWKLRRYEAYLFGRFDLCLAVSQRDRRALLDMLPWQEGRIALTPNGVDTDHHRPGLAAPQPNGLVFNGSLAYHANFDAMHYFLTEVFPLIRARAPEVELKITGRTDGVSLAALPANGGVTFTGYVDDIRPVVAGSWACVVPLRIGGGTRLKILEAMASGTPVISTSKGMEGIEAVGGEHLLVADSPAEFARQTIRLLAEPGLRATLAANARRLVEEKYSWAEIGQQFCRAVEQAESVRYGKRGQT